MIRIYNECNSSDNQKNKKMQKLVLHASKQRLPVKEFHEELLDDAFMPAEACFLLHLLH